MTMAGKQTKTPRRTTRNSSAPQSKSPSPAKTNKSRGSSPKTPGWISGKNAVFNTPKTESQSPKKPRTRRSSIYPKKEMQSFAPETSNFDFEFTTSRRKSEMFKPPDSPFGIQTRTRFSIYRKGGMRLVDIPLSPPKFTAKKSISPPRTKTRTRRSSIYHKGSKSTIVNIPLEPVVPMTNSKKISSKSKSTVASQSESAVTTQNRKKVTAKRTSSKSPTKTSPVTKKVPVSKSKSESETAVASPKFTAMKSPKNNRKTPARKVTKTPKSVTKQMKRKLDTSDEGLQFSMIMTPSAKRAKKETPVKKSPPKSARKRTRRTEVRKTPTQAEKEIATITKNKIMMEGKSPKKIPEIKQKSPVVAKSETPTKKKKSPAKTPASALKKKRKFEGEDKVTTPSTNQSKRRSVSGTRQKLSPVVVLSKTPASKVAKTPASAIKRKREIQMEDDKEKATPSPKRTRKLPVSGTRQKLSPVVVLTKTPATQKDTKNTPSRKLSPPKSIKSVKKLKTPVSAKKIEIIKRKSSLKKSVISPHVRMVTPVSTTPNLSAKKRISQRKSTPARVPKTPRVTDMAPVSMTPKLNSKSLLSSRKHKLVSDHHDVMTSDLLNNSLLSNKIDLNNSMNNSQEDTSAGNKTIYLDSVSSPLKEVDTTFGSYSGRTGRCVIL